MKKSIISRINLVAISVFVIAAFYFCENSRRSKDDNREPLLEKPVPAVENVHDVVDCHSYIRELLDSSEANFAGVKRFIYRYKLEFNARTGKTILPSADDYFISKYHGAVCTQCFAEPEIVYVAAYGDRVMKLSLEDAGILAEGKIPVVGNRAFQRMDIECVSEKIIVSFTDNLYIFGENLELVYDYHESEIVGKLYNNPNDSLGILLNKGIFFFFGLSYEVVGENELSVSGTFRKINFHFKEEEERETIDSIRVNHILLNEL